MSTSGPGLAEDGVSLGGRQTINSHPRHPQSKMPGRRDCRRGGVDSVKERGADRGPVSSRGPKEPGGSEAEER